MDTVSATPLLFSGSTELLAPSAALLAGGASALAAGLATLFAAHIARRRALVPVYESPMAEGIGFVFSGDALWMATAAGQSILKREGAATDREGLLRYLRRHGLELEARLERLLDHGTAFKVETALADGAIWLVEGRPQGAMSGVFIRDLTQSETRVRELTDTLDRVTAERERFGGILNSAPFAACEYPARGSQFTWANDAYNRLAQENAENAEALAAAAREAGASGTARISLADGDSTVWFDIVTRPGARGGTILYALPADRLVATEDALRRFVGTLTETFAHLSVGLAVFGEDRRLSIFNPALGDLTTLKPDWLAARPTIRAVFDRLREHGIMPVQPNFEQFRATLARIEAAAAAGTLSETWQQPTGRTFRISGRPHPNNAVAIMMEDITDTVTLERQFRSEISLGRAALDCVEDAIAIFDLAGRVSFANKGFYHLWDLPRTWSSEDLTLQTISAHCSSGIGGPGFWARLRDFTTALQNRAQWAMDVILPIGSTTEARIYPMPDGSTLAMFSRPADAAPNARAMPRRAEATWAAGLFREALLEAAEQLGTTSPLAADLRAAVQHGDAADEIAADPASEAAAQNGLDALQRQLTSLVTDRGHRIDLEIDSAFDPGDLPGPARHGILSLLLAIKSLSEPRARLCVSLAQTDAGMRVMVTTRAASGLSGADPALDTLPLRILSRLTGGRSEVRAFALEDGGAGLMLALPADAEAADIQAEEKRA